MLFEGADAAFEGVLAERQSIDELHGGDARLACDPVQRGACPRGAGVETVQQGVDVGDIGGREHCVLRERSSGIGADPRHSDPPQRDAVVPAEGGEQLLEGGVAGVLRGSGVELFGVGSVDRLDAHDAGHGAERRSECHARPRPAAISDSDLPGGDIVGDPVGEDHRAALTNSVSGRGARPRTSAVSGSTGAAWPASIVANRLLRVFT